MREKNVVVLLSGGMDSTTQLYDVLSKKDARNNVSVMSVNYGQRHKVELDIAKQHVTRLVKNPLETFTGQIVDHKVVDFDFSIFGGSPLTDPEWKVPKQSDNQQESTVVPYRNTVLITLAAMFAHKSQSEEIYISAVYDDLKAYPDCRPEYYESLQRTLRLGGVIHNLKVKVPYNELTKVEIVKLGLELGVDYSLTHTCYNGSTPPCLDCDADRERMDAFKQNGVRDPLVSEELWSKYLTETM